VIHRAARLYDAVVVAVADNESKKPLFSQEDRLALVEQSIQSISKVRADAFNGLLVDYADRMQAQVIIRGLRAISDFEFEFQLALMNRKLREEVETIFMMPRDTYTFLSSRMVKEIARLGGNVADLVPASVLKALETKLAKRRTHR
jgi:pantetheine-phosphate adenylyltransferase